MSIHRLLGLAVLGGIAVFASLPVYSQAQDPPPAKGDGGSEGPRWLPPPPPVSSPNLTPTLIDRASATVSVIQGEDLKSLGVEDFIDGLRVIPGVEIQKISASEDSVSVRSYTAPGAYSQGILGLLDGRQVYNDFFGGVFWNSLPVSMDEIKSIEVIRGPGSFLYGPNAMHGLVNIVTRSPLDYAEGSYANHEVFLSGMGGSYGANVETLTFVHREGDAGFKVTASHDDIDQFEGGGDAKNKIFATVRYVQKLENDEVIDISGGASRQHFDVLFPGFITAGSLLPTATYATDAEEYFLKADFSAADRLKAQASWTHFAAEGQPTAVYSPFDLVLDTVDLDLQYLMEPIAGHHVTIGTGYRYSTFVTDHPDVSLGRHGAGLAWGFVQDEWSITREIFLTGGARIDDHSVAGISVSPRLALVWEFAPPPPDPARPAGSLPEPGQALRLTAGYGFQNPCLRDLWFNMQINPQGLPLPSLANPSPYRVVGNTSLRPEEMRSFEMGYWGRPTSALQAECSVYYNLANRLERFEFDGTPGVGGTVSRQNVDNEDAYGVEANVEYQLTRPIYVFGNYAYEIRKDRDTGDRIPGGPRNKANTGLRVSSEESLSAMVWVNFFDESTFTDRATGYPLGSVPAYALLNFRVWYPLHLGHADGKIFVQAFNALDHIHQEHPQGDAYGMIAMAGLEIAW